MTVTVGTEREAVLLLLDPDPSLPTRPPVDDPQVDRPAPSPGPPAARPTASRGPTPRRIVQAAVLSLPVAVLAWAAWTHRNMFVDGYIYLHIVQNILAGHGPVFNSGQRVEAFTSPAWTLILSVAGFTTGAPLVSIAVVLGIALSVGGVALAIVGSSGLSRRAMPGSFLLPLGAVVFVAVPAVWSLATSGLETGLQFAWLGACLTILVRWSRSSTHHMGAWALVVLGLGPLVRPELALDSMVFVGVLLVVDRSGLTWRGRARTVAWAVALPLAYQVFRMGYYGALVATTATAKEASLPRLGRGVVYFTDFVDPYWLFVPAIGLLVGAYYPLVSTLRRTAGGDRSLAALLALPTAAVLNAAYIVLMGGDYVHARLLIAPFFAVCAPVASIPLARRTVVSLLVVPWSVLCMASLRTPDGGPWSANYFAYVDGHGSFSPTHAVLGPSGHQPAWTPQRGVYVQFSGPTTITRLTTASPSGLRTPLVATSWIGHEPYAWGPGVQILDLLGLADPLAAHLQLSNRGLVSGHEKPLPTSWVAAMVTAPGSSTAQLSGLQDTRPTLFTPLTPVVHGHQLAVETAWARAALGCPAIRDLRDSPSAPLTVASFFGNMVHAAARSALRIPPDPETAYHQFCGPGTPASVRTAEAT